MIFSVILDIPQLFIIAILLVIGRLIVFLDTILLSIFLLLFLSSVLLWAGKKIVDWKLVSRLSFFGFISFILWVIMDILLLMINWVYGYFDIYHENDLYDSIGIGKLPSEEVTTKILKSLIPYFFVLFVCCIIYCVIPFILFFLQCRYSKKAIKKPEKNDQENVLVEEEFSDSENKEVKQQVSNQQKIYNEQQQPLQTRDIEIKENNGPVY